MGHKRDMMMLAVLSVVMIVVSLAGIAWDFFSGLLFGGLDGILLAAICLMMGGVFTLELGIVSHKAGWIPRRAAAAPAAKAVAAPSVSSVAAKPTATAPAAAPASPATPPKPAAPPASAAAPNNPAAPAAAPMPASSPMVDASPAAPASPSPAQEPAAPETAK